jgi:hypothetical protein
MYQHCGALDKYISLVQLDKEDDDENNKLLYESQVFHHAGNMDRRLDVINEDWESKQAESRTDHCEIKNCSVFGF